MREEFILQFIGVSVG